MTETPIQRLRRVSDAHAEMANKTVKVYRRAAQTEADHRHARARAVLRFKGTEDGRMSQAEAETRADADDTVSALHLARLVAAADADSLKAKLFQLREEEASARTQVVDVRESDRITATRGDIP